MKRQVNYSDDQTRAITSNVDEEVTKTKTFDPVMHELDPIASTDKMNGTGSSEKMNGTGSFEIRPLDPMLGSVARWARRARFESARMKTPETCQIFREI